MLNDWTKQAAIDVGKTIVILISLLFLFFMLFAVTGAFAGEKSCTRRVAEDYHTLEAATKRLDAACKADLMGEQCTLAIEDGDRAVEASNRLKISCPDVSWSWDQPKEWSPDQ